MTSLPRLVPRAQILPPPEPLRVSMDDGPMLQLKLSIGQIGILYPLLVLARWGDGPGTWRDEPDEKLGDRPEQPDAYEIIDGHRRFVAAELLELPSVPVLVCETTEQAKFAMMLDANVCREDVTPFEEGVQFLDLATKHQWSMPDLQRTFNKSEDYINDRVEIVRKDQAVAEAVRDRQIGLGQAKEVLKCADPAWRPVLLEQAAVHGATVKALREMRHQHDRDLATAQGEIPMSTGVQFVPGAVFPPDECIWCGKAETPEAFVVLKVHQYELSDMKAVLEKFSMRALLRQVGEK
jgi:ParB-like chromosome segregation protein Spo0J